MRDSFGGVFTMNLLLVFIFIYVAVTAVSLNYAKAFRLKNSVIDFVEQNEIIKPEDIGNKANLLQKLDNIIANGNYNKPCNEVYHNGNRLSEGIIRSDEGNITGYCHNGIVIDMKEGYPKYVTGTTSKVYVYEIKTYADWELGAFNKLLALAGRNGNAGLAGTWTVIGEAKVIKKS